MSIVIQSGHPAIIDREFSVLYTDEQITAEDITSLGYGYYKIKTSDGYKLLTINDGEEVTAEETIVENVSDPQDEKPYEKYVFYREDFEIPDCHNLGYTNLIDFYNDYPNGKSAGTYGNAGIMVHYREDMDMDLPLEESLAFKTYRGIGLGSSLDEVFDAYGSVDIEQPFEELAGMSNEEHTLQYFVVYWAKIESGAAVEMRFYFDQNDKVMEITMGAVYETYAANVSGDNVFEIVND